MSAGSLRERCPGCGHSCCPFPGLECGGDSDVVSRCAGSLREREECVDHSPRWHRGGVGCPECGRFMAHSWVSPGRSTEYGWDQSWGGICPTHGRQWDYA